MLKVNQDEEEVIYMTDKEMREMVCELLKYGFFKERAKLHIQVKDYKEIDPLSGPIEEFFICKYGHKHRVFDEREECNNDTLNVGRRHTERG